MARHNDLSPRSLSATRPCSEADGPVRALKRREASRFRRLSSARQPHQLIQCGCVARVAHNQHSRAIAAQLHTERTVRWPHTQPTKAAACAADAADRGRRLQLAHGHWCGTIATWCVAVIISCCATTTSPNGFFLHRRAERRHNTRCGVCRSPECVL